MKTRKVQTLRSWMISLGVLLTLPVSALAECPVTVPNNCLCSAYGTLNGGQLAVASIRKASQQRWSSTTVTISEGAIPSWWGAYPTDAITYWDNTDLSVSEGGGGIAISYYQSESNWDILIAANLEHNPDLTRETPAFTRADGLFVSTASIYFNCAWLDDNNWNDGDSAFGYDTFHVYAHEIGHAVGLAHVDAGYNECTVMSHPTSTLIDTDVRDLDKKAIGCIYGTPGTLLATAVPFDAAMTACGFPTDAKLTSFRVDGDFATWSIESENHTAGYELQVAGEDQEWHRVAVFPAGDREYAHSLRGFDKAWVRLREILDHGPVFTLAVRRGQSSPPPPEAEFKEHRLSSELSRTAASSRLPSGGPDILIVTVNAFTNVANQLSSYWQGKGHSVDVEVVTGSDSYWRRRNAGQAIRNYAVSGTRYFHLIGDSEHIAARYDLGLPSHDPESVYLQSTDQELADTNYDGRPNVVLTRWPVDDIYDAACAFQRLVSHDASLKSFAETSPINMLVDDEDNGIGGVPGYYTKAMADAIQSEITSRAIFPEMTRLNATAYPDFDDRNAATASLINATHPDLLVMLASGSQRRSPGNFFDRQFATWPWTNVWLERDVPIVLVPSCGSCDFTDYGGGGADETCQDFFGRNGFFSNDCRAGSVLWIGSQEVDVDQPINWAFESLVLEEMFRRPDLPVSEAYLAALNRMYDGFSSEPDAEDLNRMIVLGDPLSAYRRIPRHRIESFVQKPGSPDLLPMQTNFAVGCPGRDVDQIVIKVALDANDVPIAPTVDDITISHQSTASIYSIRMYPDGANFLPQGSVQFVGSDPDFPNGCYKCTFTLASIGGCGLDSVLVSLYHLPVGHAPINIRSPDLVTTGTSSGKVTLADYSEFSYHYPPPKPYSACEDYVAPYAPPISTGDFSFFCVHYMQGHEYTESFSVDELRPSHSNKVLETSVHVDVQRSNPVVGERLLVASVRLEGPEPYKVMMLGLSANNSALEFVGWEQAPSFSGGTMCAQIEVDGGRIVCLGVVGAKDASSGTASLGSMIFRINSDAPLEIENDFNVVVADILSRDNVEGALPLSGITRVFAPIAYRNELAQNYPNPFNPTTTIAYALENDSDVELRIFDVAGTLVKTVVKGRQSEGVHRVQWDGRNGRGQAVASGVYFYKLAAGSFVDTKKMIMIK